jgi:F0F1-type ATP synthase membrane subunit a
MFYFYFFLFISLIVFCTFSFIKKGLKIRFNILQHKHRGQYFVLSLLLFLLILNLLFGGFSFFYSYGLSLIFIFLCSVSFWFPSLLVGIKRIFHSFYGSTVSLLGLLLFNNFIAFLRPITLTLRLFINLSLGHFVIDLIRFRILTPLFLMVLL